MASTRFCALLLVVTIWCTVVTTGVADETGADGKVVSTVMTDIYCYHGSPGTAEDFTLIKDKLTDCTVVAVKRLGYPASPSYGNFAQGGTIPDGEKPVLLGYSWGALAALRDGAANVDRIAGVVLVAPYLGGKELSGGKKFLMSWKFPGHLIVGLMANSIVDKLLTKSSAPKDVPPEYKALKGKLATAQVLARSVLEKAEEGMSAEEACTVLREKEVPVLLIVGAKDGNEGSQDYGKNVEKWLSPQKALYVEDGGHAMLWTHPELLAKEIQTFLTGLK